VRISNMRENVILRIWGSRFELYLEVTWSNWLVAQLLSVLRSWISSRLHFAVRSQKDTAWQKLAQLVPVPGPLTRPLAAPSALLNPATKSSCWMFPRWAMVPMINQILAESFVYVAGTVSVFIIKVFLALFEILDVTAENSFSFCAL
jgi:hypothetical protein